MLRKLLGLNMKGFQIAFFAGSTFGGILGCLAGMTAGVALGTLFAPKAGRELRKELSDTMGAFAETAKEKGLELADVAKEKGMQIKEKTGDFSNKMSEKMKEKVQGMKEAV